MSENLLIPKTYKWTNRRIKIRDMPSFQNLIIEDAAEKLRKAMTNESDGGFGIDRKTIIQSRNNYKRMHHKPMERRIVNDRVNQRSKK